MSLLRNRYALLAIAALAVAGGLTAVRVDASLSDKKPALTAPPATSVDVATVVSRHITDWQAYSGRLQAINQVEIRPLVSGTLTIVHFKDGSRVKKGDILFTIDPRPYVAAVDRAEAQLAAAKARAAYTASDRARGQRLLADNAIAKRDFEEKRNASREAAANLQAAQAVLESAQLDLEHTQIRAPISGRVSRAELTPGNIVSVSANSAPLTTLVSVDRMYASFDLDEQSFLKLSGPARSADGQATPVHLGLANEEGYPHTGRLASLDNQLDASSGTIRARAVFDNTDGMLVPGLYARIRLDGGLPHAAVLIDEKAIGTDQDKRFVLVVDGADKAMYRQVTLGARHDGLRVIQKGLKSGERIVVNGLQRIRPGDRISPKTVAMGGTDPATPTSVAAADTDKPVPTPDSPSKS